MGNTHSYIENGINHPPIVYPKTYEGGNVFGSNVMADIISHTKGVLDHINAEYKDVESLNAYAEISVSVSGCTTPVNGFGPIVFPANLKKFKIYNISNVPVTITKLMKGYTEAINDITPTDYTELLVLLSLPADLTKADLINSINNSIIYAVNELETLAKNIEIESTSSGRERVIISFDSITFDNCGKGTSIKPLYKNHFPKNLWKLASASVQGAQLVKFASDAVYHFSTVEMPGSSKFFAANYGTKIVGDGTNKPSSQKSMEELFFVVMVILLLLIVVAVAVPHIIHILGPPFKTRSGPPKTNTA